MKSRSTAIGLTLLAGLAAIAAASSVQAQAARLLHMPTVVETPVAATDWRTVAPENLWVIDTTKGRILVELAPRAAPNHVARIIALTERGFYDGLKFHRVIPNFMAQTGDPEGTGAGGSDLPDVKGEFEFRRTDGIRLHVRLNGVCGEFVPSHGRSVKVAMIDMTLTSEGPALLTACDVRVGPDNLAVAPPPLAPKPKTPAQINVP